MMQTGNPFKQENYLFQQQINFWLAQKYRQ